MGAARRTLSIRMHSVEDDYPRYVFSKTAGRILAMNSNAVKLPLCLAVTAAMFSWCFCPSLTAGARAATPATSPFSDGSYTGASPNQAATPLSGSVLIPGPLRPFLRMAGISQQILPEDVLPLLSRNVFTLGYSSGKPTEFLILLDRYVEHARELVLLAGTDSVMHASNCDDG